MADEMNTERDMPEGITRDDTVHGETYYTAADMATASAQGFRGGVASLSAAEPVAWRYVPSKIWKDHVFTDVRSKMELALKYGCEVTPLYAHPAPTLTQGAAIAALPSECDSPEICSISKSCAGQFGSKRICASHGQAPAAPPECKTEAERTAFAFGWFKALEHQRGQAPAQQVMIDFAQVGIAGPFVVVNGRVSLPDSTMQDLVHMLRPTYEEQAAQAQPNQPPRS